jgi:predicted PurR-regulated permease PerM
LIPRKRRVVIVSLAILLLLGLFWARTVVKAAIVLGLLGVFLADVIAPPVEALRRRITIGPRRRALPRGLAIGLVYVALAASAIPLALATPRLERQMSQLRHHAPEYLAATGSRIRAAGRLYRHYPVPIQIEAAARTLGARGASFVQRQTSSNRSFATFPGWRSSRCWRSSS